MVIHRPGLMFDFLIFLGNTYKLIKDPFLKRSRFFENPDPDPGLTCAEKVRRAPPKRPGPHSGTEKNPGRALPRSLISIIHYMDYAKFR